MKHFWTVAEEIQAHDEYLRRREIMSRTDKPHIYKLPSGRWFALRRKYHSNINDDLAELAVRYFNRFKTWGKK